MNATIDTVKQFMSQNPQCIEPRLTLLDAAMKMKEINAGFLPVCENDKIVGVITDRDIVINGLASGHSQDAQVREVMIPKTVCCFENDKLEEVAQKMGKYSVRRILVLNEGKKLVGILSLDDLASRTGMDALTANILRQANAKITKNK